METIYCPYCGEKIPLESKFCLYCGKSINLPRGIQREPPEELVSPKEDTKELYEKDKDKIEENAYKGNNEKKNINIEEEKEDENPSKEKTSYNRETEKKSSFKHSKSKKASSLLRNRLSKADSSSPNASKKDTENENRIEEKKYSLSTSKDKEEIYSAERRDIVKAFDSNNLNGEYDGYYENIDPIDKGHEYDIQSKRGAKIVFFIVGYIFFFVLILILVNVFFPMLYQ